MTEWEKDPGNYCTQFWPGWDAKLTPFIKARLKITDISKLTLLIVISIRWWFSCMRGSFTECWISSAIWMNFAYEKLILNYTLFHLFFTSHHDAKLLTDCGFCSTMQNQISTINGFACCKYQCLNHDCTIMYSLTLWEMDVAFLLARQNFWIAVYQAFLWMYIVASDAK